MGWARRVREEARSVGDGCGMGEYSRDRFSGVAGTKGRMGGGSRGDQGSGDSRSEEAGGLRLHDGHVFWGVG